MSKWYLGVGVLRILRLSERSAATLLLTGVWKLSFTEGVILLQCGVSCISVVERSERTLLSPRSASESDVANAFLSKRVTLVMLHLPSSSVEVFTREKRRRSFLPERSTSSGFKVLVAKAPIVKASGESKTTFEQCSVLPFADESVLLVHDVSVSSVVLPSVADLDIRRRRLSNGSLLDTLGVSHQPFFRMSLCGLLTPSFCLFLLGDRGSHFCETFSLGVS